MLRVVLCGECSGWLRQGPLASALRAVAVAAVLDGAGGFVLLSVFELMCGLVCPPCDLASVAWRAAVNGSAAAAEMGVFSDGGART